MWQYTWPDSFLLSPLAGFLRVHLDCGIPWPCFPGLNYWQFSCSCGYRQSRAWTFLTSRGQAHPSIIEMPPLENLEMSERAEVIFPLIILADAHFSHDTPRNSCSIFRSRAALRLEDLALRPRLISGVALPKAGGSKRLQKASFRADMRRPGIWWETGCTPSFGFRRRWRNCARILQ